MTARIDVDDLTLTYGETTALDRLAFSMEGGKIHGLLGRNGSGKSSLLSVIAAFRKATSGEVLIDGQPVFENPVVTSQAALIREGGDTVEESEKISEALRYAAWLRPNWDAECAARLMDRFELTPKLKIGELSRGKRSALGWCWGWRRGRR